MLVWDLKAPLNNAKIAFPHGVDIFRKKYFCFIAIFPFLAILTKSPLESADDFAESARFFGEIDENTVLIGPQVVSRDIWKAD